MESRFENAKNYWKLFKKICLSDSPKTLKSQHFANYFKAMNNPDSRFFQADEGVLLYNERYVQGELGVIMNKLV